MKKLHHSFRFYFLNVGLLFASIFFPDSALASSLATTSESLSVQPGDTFVIPIRIDASGEAQYTAGFSVTFPPAMLEVVSFAFDTAWIPLSQPGYDLTDNTEGILMKTGGFPMGFTSSQTFGTITFRAKEAGDGLVRFTPDSFVLNAANKNTLETYPQIQIVAVEPPVDTQPVDTQPVDAPAAIEAPIVAPVEPEQTNLFDIVSEPEAPTVSRPISVYVLLAGLGVVLGIACLVFISWMHRLRLMRRWKREASRSRRPRI